MKNFKCIIALCVALVCLHRYSYAANIIVNPGESIQNAVNMADPGDVILVQPGVYGEVVTFRGSSNSGAHGAMITLKANGSLGTVVLDGTGITVSGRQGMISIIGSSFIRVEGFEIRNFVGGSGRTPVGIYVEGTCNTVEIVDNKIHDIKNTTTCSGCSEGAHGLAVYGTTPGGISNLLIQGNEVYNNVLQASEALVLNSNVDGFKVLNNYVHDNNNIGFDFIGFEGECYSCSDEQERVRNGLVANNIAENNRSDLANPWYAGDPSAGGFYVDGGKNIIFEGNRSFGNNMGFEFASEHNGRNTENIIMRNNYISNNTEVGVSVGGSVSNAEALNVVIVNNTFYKNRGWGSEIVFQKNVKNSTVANNIFYADNTDAYENAGGGHSNNTWRNNLYYNGGAGGGSVSTANPKLVDPDNNNLDIESTSPAINLGVNLGESMIGSTDIKGNARIYNGSVDLGAHEYGSVPIGGTVPVAPTNLNASPVSTTQISLNWTDNSNNEDGFEVQQSSNGTSGWAQVATTTPNSTESTINGLTTGTQYFFRVRATNSNGNSSWSNITSATTSQEPGSGEVNIVIDGNADDWSKVSVLASNAGTTLKVYDDASDIFFLVSGTLDSHSLVFINTDNSSTGYTYDWPEGGLDYYVEDANSLYDYTGSGTNWSWSFRSGASGFNSPNVEFKVSKARLGTLGSTIKVGVSIEDSDWSQTNAVPASSNSLVPYALGNHGLKLQNALSLEAKTEQHNIVYPNIIQTGDLNFQFNSNKIQLLPVQIINQSGRRVMETTVMINKGVNTYSISVDHLPEGLYFISMNTGDEHFLKKFLLK